MQFRRLENKDMDHWVSMRRSLWPSGSLEEHRREVLDLLKLDEFVAFSAWSEGEPIGFLELFVRPFANGCSSRPVPFIEGVWVSPDARGKGVARKLVELVEQWALSKGFTEIGSDADLNNSKSHDAHKGWGFEETERVVYFRKRLEF